MISLKLFKRLIHATIIILFVLIGFYLLDEKGLFDEKAEQLRQHYFEVPFRTKDAMHHSVDISLTYQIDPSKINEIKNKYRPTKVEVEEFIDSVNTTYENIVKPNLKNYAYTLDSSHFKNIGIDVEVLQKLTNSIYKKIDTLVDVNAIKIGGCTLLSSITVFNLNNIIKEQIERRRDEAARIIFLEQKAIEQKHIILRNKARAEAEATRLKVAAGLTPN